MMVGKEDLALSLSLGSLENHHHRFPPHSLQLNLMPSTSTPPPQPFLLQHNTQWRDLLGASPPERGSPEEATRPMLRGIDVNRAPPPSAAERESEEEAGASSPNSALSSVSGKRGERDPAHLNSGGGRGEENDTERASSRGGISDEEDGEGSRKKLRLSKDQSAILEESFKEHNTLNPKQKLALAKQLNLRPRQVEVWFQNRRARTKLKQTEVDCEFLKRCCENLTEENRRLQKELSELRALKLSPQLYMHMTPPTTLTMCPSCERVAASNSAGAGATSSSAFPSTAPPPPDHHHQHHQQRQPFSIATPAPWAPIPLRPSFMDVHPQRS